MTAAAPAPLAFEIRRGRLVAGGVVCALFAGACALFPEPLRGVAHLGWAGALAAAVCFLQASHRGPALVLSARGLLDRRQGVGLVPWEEVASVRTAGATGREFLLLALRDPVRRSDLRSNGVVAAFRRALGVKGDVVVRIGELTPGVDEAIAYVRALPGGAALTDVRPPSWTRS